MFWSSGLKGRAGLSLSHRELKHDIFPSEPLVDASKGVKLVLCAVALLGVQVDLCGTKYERRQGEYETRSGAGGKPVSATPGSYTHA